MSSKLLTLHQKIILTLKFVTFRTIVTVPTCNNKPFVPNRQHFSKNKTNFNNHSLQPNDNSIPSTSKDTSNNKNSFNSNQSSTFNKPNQNCFNCKSAGHTFRVCKQKRKVFCYHCGEPNVKFPDCIAWQCFKVCA